MSIDLNWDTLTGGPDGEALAESIRDFIHTKFQAVPLPRFIKSVKVHDFRFGSIPPKVVLKDICDPLPDFYEEMPEADALDDDDDDDDEDDDADDEDDSEYGGGHGHGARGRIGDDGVPDAIRAAEKRRRDEQKRRLAGAGGQHGYGYGYGYHSSGSSRSTSPRPPRTPEPSGSSTHGFPPHIHTAGLRSAPGTPDLTSPFLGLAVSAATPGGGIPGGTSNMHYFPSHIATGWSGTQTPLAAFAGHQAHLNGWLDNAAAGGRRNGGAGSSPSTSYYNPPSPSPAGPSGGGGGYDYGHNRHSSQSSVSVQDLSSTSDSSSLLATATTTQPQQPQGQGQGQGQLAPPLLREKHSVSTLAPTSVGTGPGASRPPTRDNAEGGNSGGKKGGRGGDGDDDDHRSGRGKLREPRVEDMQAVFRIQYAGDVQLMLTAEILLDYPMPSFVGIPVKLNISGLSFDGVGVVAYIRRRVHFCFLSPEDAVTAVGADDDDDDEDEDEEGEEEASGAQKQKEARPKGRMGGLLQEIRVESEIGLREGSKQSLKNVGKVERFVLEQVRRIFEEEFVYPSFWTFLV